MKGLTIITIGLVLAGSIMGSIANKQADKAATAVEGAVQQRLDTSMYGN